MAKVHSTNKGNDGSFTKSAKKTDGTSDIDTQLNGADAIREQVNRIQLPAEEERTANINFLGSSFSGQDIKVVAHLYDQAPQQEDLQTKIQRDLDIAIHTKDGATALIGGALESVANNDFENSTQKRDALRGATGLTGGTPAEEQAFSTLYNVVFLNRVGTDINSFLGIAKIRQQLTSISNIQTSLEKDLNEKLERLAKTQEVGHRTIVLGTLQTLSVQSHREKFAVRALGHSYAKAYTRGQRTIAGSMIFTVFEEHALAALTRGLYKKDDIDPGLSTYLPDQLPPVDLTIAFANEYGQLSEARLYGVEFVNDGVVYSIEDLLSENTINYVCRDADLLANRGRVELDRELRYKNQNEDMANDKTGSSLQYDNQDYKDYLDRLGVRRRFKHQ